MTAAEMYAGKLRVKINKRSFSTREGGIKPMEHPDISWLITLSALCNETTMGRKGDRESLEGSSTEKALMALAKRAGVNLAALKSDRPVVNIVHRTDERPFMMTLHRRRRGRLFTAVKGSALEVLELCARFRRGGRAVPLTEKDRHRIEEENFRMAGRGLRVLGVAYCSGLSGEELQQCGKEDRPLVWGGLVALEDPLRKGAGSLIAQLHRAGIRTAVITGDQSLTAQHIGERLGLSGDEPLRILDASQFGGSRLHQMDMLPARTHVFARLNPRQKLQLIQAFQRNGMRVAMVGDGINDVLALKVADVGIAMGKDGAELARQTADLVLEDDDLLAIPAAIADGRAFYENMGKSLRFLLTTSNSDIITELTLGSGLTAQGASVWQGVWTNLLCLSLARDPAAPGVMERPPRGVAEGVLADRELEDTVKDAIGLTAVAGAAGSGGLITGGWGADRGGLFARSVSVNQMLYAETCREREGGNGNRSTRNPLLRTTLSLTVGGYLLSTLLRGIGGGPAAWGAAAVNTALLGAGGMISLGLLRKNDSEEAV
jgi:Ca2+-transporting ATPase